MSDVAVLINDQSGQLWSLAMIVLTAQVVALLGYTRSMPSGPRSDRVTLILLFCIFLIFVSFLFGYITKGATILMAKNDAHGGDTSLNFEDAALYSFLQGILFAFSFVISSVTLLIRRSKFADVFRGFFNVKN